MSEQCDIAVDLGVLPRAALTLAPYMFSGYDFLAFSHAQVSPSVPQATWECFSLRCSTEASVASRSGTAQREAAGKTRPRRSRRPLRSLPAFGYCVPFELLLFLRRQENEADAFAQRAIGGVRELVQPSDGLWPVRSPARAAHARCSQLERLPERRPGPSARISKDE